MERGTDVVLVDTAGRMQDNEPLMRSLAKVFVLTFLLIKSHCHFVNQRTSDYYSSTI